MGVRDRYGARSVGYMGPRSHPNGCETRSRTDPPRGQNVSGAAGARLGTLAPPLSRYILLGRENEASCHLGGRGEAWRSSQPACARVGHHKRESETSTPTAWAACGHWKAHTIERSVAELGGALGLTLQVVDTIAHLLSLMPSGEVLCAHRGGDYRKISRARRASRTLTHHPVCHRAGRRRGQVACSVSSGGGVRASRSRLCADSPLHALHAPAVGGAVARDLDRSYLSVAIIGLYRAWQRGVASDASNQRSAVWAISRSTPPSTKVSVPVSGRRETRLFLISF